MEFHSEGSRTDTLIGCLTYQSKASSPPTDDELDDLVASARSRNNSVGVTGMLLYDNGRFLQTLEGPPDGLDAIWSSIREDERHSDIEVLTKHLVSGRLFSDWDLLLYRKLPHTTQSMWDKLRRKHPLTQHIGKVAEQALNADDSGLNNLFAKLAEKGWSGDEVAMHLIEPAARVMGDAWLADECSEFDLTLGLGMLQMASHAVRYTRDPSELRATSYSILLAAAPGEQHLLSPTLLADQFSDAGWGVELAFPTSDEALANQISEQCPDAVDLALSDALSRHGRIAKLRESVKHSRQSVPDQPLVVSVGGRLFAEAAATAEHVGADLARPGLAGTRLRLAELVGDARSRESVKDYS